MENNFSLDVYNHFFYWPSISAAMREALIQYLVDLLVRQFHITGWLTYCSLLAPCL